MANRLLMIGIQVVAEVLTEARAGWEETLGIPILRSEAMAAQLFREQLTWRCLAEAAVAVRATIPAVQQAAVAQGAAWL